MDDNKVASPVKLKCAMAETCHDEVAMIDDSGWVYCKNHGLQRRSWKRCRTLRPHELNRLKRGEQITKY